MMKLKFQYFGHLMRRVDSSEKNLTKKRSEELKSHFSKHDIITANRHMKWDTIS